MSTARESGGRIALTPDGLRLLPNRSFAQMFNLSFGFFGIQIAFALQGANVSRIFQSLGASIEDLPILWIAAPLTGLLVQPLIGHYSDRTWSERFGRRRPYFCVGAVLSCAALLAMPAASVLWVAAVWLWVLDASINVSMEPFRAFVGDLLCKAQRTMGYAFQTVFIGTGAVTASLCPLVLNRVFHVANTGVGVPPSVRLAFFAGAGALFIAVMWTVLTTREYPPPDSLDASPHLLAVPSPHGIAWVSAGAALGLITALLHLNHALYVLAGLLAAFGGARMWRFARAQAGRPSSAIEHLLADLDAMPGAMRKLALVQFCSWFALFILWIYATPVVAARAFGAASATDPAYGAGADWVGVMFAVYNAVAALAAFALPLFSRRFGVARTHQAALIAGAMAFAGLFVIRDPWWMLLPMVGIGIAWASILTLPYTLLCDVAPPSRLGAYMGLFNIFITLPQLLVSTVMGAVLHVIFPGRPHGAMLCAAAAMILAAFATQRLLDKARLSEQNAQDADIACR